MEKEEWLRKCAAQYEKCAAMPAKDAFFLAVIALDEDKDGDFTDNPEWAADADMECWDDDA
jgi:hypothetical protein